MSLKIKHTIGSLLILLTFLTGYLLGCAQRDLSTSPYVESPGTWYIDSGNMNYVVEYSNSNDITLIPVDKDVRIDGLNKMLLECYVDRTKMISVYSAQNEIHPVFYLTVDEGKTWNRCAVTSSSQWNKKFTYAHIGFSSPDFGWCFLGNDGDLSFGVNSLYITENGGNSWHERPSITVAQDSVVNSIFFSTPKVGFICTNRRRVDGEAPIYKTTDGGNSWFEIELPLSGNGNTYEGTGISFNGPFGILQLSCYKSNTKTYSTLFSNDWGTTWNSTT